MKHLIQERNNEAWLGIKPSSKHDRKWQANVPTTRTLAVLLFAYISLPCVNFLFLIML